MPIANNMLNTIERPSEVRSKHVTLIRPAMISSISTWSNPITPPLGVAYLAAMLREYGHQVDAIDAIGEKVDQYAREDGYLIQGLTIDETVDRIDPQTELIGISCMFTQDWLFVRRMIHKIRERFPYTPIVAGGEHVTALPEYTLQDCPDLDFLVLGEGEESIVEMANHADDIAQLRQVHGIAYLDDDGQYVQTCARSRIRDVDDVPYPAWDLFPMEAYLDNRNAHGVYHGRSMGILATRGCPYKCTFCSNPVMYGKLWLARDPGKVLDEIEHYIRTYNAENIDFYDLTMILKKDWIIEFCRMIEERGLKFSWQLPTGTRSEVIDEDVAPLLYRTGCTNLTYAPESGSPDTLDRIKKRVNLDRLCSSIRAALGAGTKVKCNIIIGFPHETRKHIIQTILFCWKLAWLGVHDVGVFLFSPYPGSKLFEELREDGTIGELNDSYFRSLVAFMDPFAPSEFCKAVSGKELLFWRLFGMASFFGLSYVFRPWRLVTLIKNLIRNESDTVLAQRLGAIIRRPAARKNMPAVVQSSA